MYIMIVHFINTTVNSAENRIGSFTLEILGLAFIKSKILGSHCKTDYMSDKIVLAL